MNTFKFFDVLKNDVSLFNEKFSTSSGMSFYIQVQCSFNQCQNLGVQIRLSKDDHVQVHTMFENLCLSSFDEMVFDPWLLKVTAHL